MEASNRTTRIDIVHPLGHFAAPLPRINIVLSFTDYLLQTNRAACTLFRLLSCVACKLCKPGKYQTMIVNRITSRNADHVYTVFFQRTFFFLDIFGNGKKNVSLFLRQNRRKFYLSFSRGYSCNTRFFYTWKEHFINFDKPDLLV